ncbi:MAG: hypothetical protein HFJ48_04460 [Clostridia bacterium]|nr:hypothetical protein [Clostridia bacterium]
MVVTNDKNIKRMCSFYVSDFHLEMIILPYIAEKINENKNIKIVTESSLEQSMKVLLSKINLKNKEDILKIGWENNCLDNIDDNTVVIINGTEKFIKEKNDSIKQDNIEIVNCFRFEEVKDKMEDIVNKHEKVINSLKNI